MRYRNILPNQILFQFGIIYNLFIWCRHNQNCKFKINYANEFLYDIKTPKYWPIAVETLWCTFTWFTHERYMY